MNSFHEYITDNFQLQTAAREIAGAADELDFGQGFPHFKGVWEGPQQYDDIEQVTDL